jgi:hypothetical protein
MGLTKLGTLPDRVIKKILQDIASRQLVKYLEESPFTEFRIAKQVDGHYIVHPMGKDGETLDMKWIIDDEVRNSNTFTDNENDID